MKPRSAPALIVALVLGLTLVAAGCGSSSLSVQQLRTGATRACTVARQRLSQIPTPALPRGGSAFLKRGIATLRPELAELERLHPGGELAAQYDRARTATERELAALRSSLKGLRAGNDPVVAIKTLQQQLVPLELRAASAWRALGIDACTQT